ncbi:MAG TPA: DUF885 family protein [Thermoanaerobaculia bacterium]|nr:DUF885 family protein [Thermoanaerobaculia bacterium]
MMRTPSTKPTSHRPLPSCSIPGIDDGGSVGPRFDLRDFHDKVLGSGSVPLDVLEKNINAWIAARQKGEAATR